jgi:hypothetical protein
MKMLQLEKIREVAIRKCLCLCIGLLFLFATLSYADDVDIKTSTTSGTNGVSITNSDGSTTILKATSDGKVGIDTATTNHTLDVNGNIGQTTGAYHNYGTTDGSSGYGIRDNSGVMEYKNSGGSWTAFTGSGSGSNAYSYGETACWHTSNFTIGTGGLNGYVPITLGSFTNNSHSSYGYVSVTSSGSNTYDQFTINSGGSGTYRISASVSIETPVTGSQAQNLEVEVFKRPSGGTFADVETLSGAFRIANSGDKDNAVVTGFLDLQDGDSIDLRIRTDASSNRVITFVCCNFNIQKIK